uniref:PR-5 thaumatin-like protein n=1 Tax=Pseudotsuga menziesii TaxID=3357 RepID=Q5QJU1_PSEMZ|nr:PR-5 thaumatin-like protein [Pseudotsuga menziesii]
MGERTIAVSFPVAATMALVLMVYLQGVGGATFTIQNQCSFTVWAAGIPVGGGQALAQGQTWSVEVPAGTSAGRFWGRTGCSFDASGQGSCTTGNCGGVLNCTGAGQPPATLAEYTLNGSNNLDTYDISLVDGFNLPLSITPSNSSCPTVDCSSNVTANCPTQLQVAEGCNSACTALNTPQYCCTGDYLNNCPATSYSEYFKGQCPQAYSYAKDDNTSTFTCPSGANYNIAFCT